MPSPGSFTSSEPIDAGSMGTMHGRPLHANHGAPSTARP